MLLNKKLHTLSILVLLSATILFAQNRISPEMVVSLKNVSTAVIDPTGKNVAYILSTARSAGRQLAAMVAGRQMDLFFRGAQGTRYT
ncbi:hypothetical protein DCC62_27725 [candidate division KSB1 bacterium]|nr:MAG: hypothetical protein DCC62_27725 [candidate division KSB1 bacterium]